MTSGIGRLHRGHGQEISCLIVVYLANHFYSCMSPSQSLLPGAMKAAVIALRHFENRWLRYVDEVPVKQSRYQGVLR